MLSIIIVKKLCIPIFYDKKTTTATKIFFSLRRNTNQITRFIHREPVEKRSELSLVKIELKLQIFAIKTAQKYARGFISVNRVIFLQNHCYTFFLY